MNRADRNAMLAIPPVLIVASLIAWASGQGGTRALGIPTFAVVVAMAFVVQWVAFIPAYLRQTEKFFDITGSITYMAVAGTAILLGPRPCGRSWLLFGLIAIWATRLGTFLFRRVRSARKDRRFDEIKPSIPRFLLTWTLQGLWVSLTLAAALAAITTSVRRPLGVFTWVGLSLWLIGFAVEVLADRQKTQFKSDAANKGRFIHTGLWSWSRHPNYFGEMLVWIGVAVIASPVLQGWQWAALISPVFVILLLTRISGIPMLERHADETWGGQDDYESYKRRTSILLPRPPRREKPRRSID